MPPQDGKVVIVTGASSGMGWYCAQALAEHGAHVIIAARSLDRCQTAAKLIEVLIDTFHLESSEFMLQCDTISSRYGQEVPRD